MSKFQYAPGLPGYGTQGADGSDGSQGLSMYFSDLDGQSQGTEIRNRINGNEILSGAGGSLPGNRIYQTGDIFVDTNGLAYEIDLSLFNNYNPTPLSRLNTSTIFIEGLDTSTDVQYKRYYNSYLTDKFIVDNVYSSSGIGNYAQSPPSTDGIYGTGAINYGSISYVDLSIGDYLPYKVWNNTGDTGAPEEAIALVKEWQANHWRWGNLNNVGVQRDTSLSLDFSVVNTNGNLSVEGNYLNFNNSSGANYIESTTNLVINSDVTLSLYSDSNMLLASNSSTTNPGDLFMQGGDSTGSGNYDGGNLSFEGGEGSNNTSTNTPGAGGHILLEAGKSGDNPNYGTFPSYTNFFGKAGGYIGLVGGAGGDVNGQTDYGIGYGGAGGDVSISGGTGGDSTEAGGIYGSYTGGTGGHVRLTGGTGGPGDNLQGNGGNVYISGGNGHTRGKVIMSSYNNADVDFYGDIEMQSGRDVKLDSGTITAPSLSFRVQSDLGLYRYELDSIALALGDGNGRQGIRFNNGSDGAYIAPIDCSLVIQPVDLTTHSNGLGIEIVTRAAGSDGGPLALRTNGGESGGDGGDIKIEAGNGSGSGAGGSITISTGTGGTNGALTLDPTSTAVGGGLYINNLTNNTGAAFHLATVGTSGPFYIDNTAPGSDIRFKDIYREIKGSEVLESFNKIQSVYWKYNEHSKEVYQGGSDTSTMHVGLIAQELQPYYPELVKSFEGDNGEVYLSIDYEMMAPLFVEALKEHQSQIEDLKAIVEKQQDQIDKLLELNNLK